MQSELPVGGMTLVQHATHATKTAWCSAPYSRAVLDVFMQGIDIGHVYCHMRYMHDLPHATVAICSA
jgi:hypothetical protein